MKKSFILSLLSISMILFSCGTGKRDATKNLTKAAGEAYYGGVFYFNEVAYLKSLFPHEVIEVVSSRITSQVYQGLVTLNQQDLMVESCIAEEYNVDSSNTVYTFKIRKGVVYHDDLCFEGGKGREVKASDFKYCFDKICTNAGNNQSYFLFRDKVVGANEYFQSSIDGKPLPGGVSGVVADDAAGTVIITLTRPFTSFLNVLAMSNCAVFPKEAYDKYGDGMRSKCVGTGPFQLANLKEQEKVILTRNPNYWETDIYGNKLPFLDAIEVSFFAEDKFALLEFEKGRLDLMYKMPLEMLEQVIDENSGLLTEKFSTFTLQRSPSLTINYLGFLHQNEFFAEKLVRQAFNYSIDRKKIVNYTLKGLAIKAHYGIVPPALVGYDAKAIKGYTFNPEKARQLLDQAGYPNGEGFPELKLHLNTGGGRHTMICEAIAKMLKENLNVSVKIEEVPWPQHLDNLDRGKSNFFRSGWVADYPDPENFLQLFLSVHVPTDPSGKSLQNTPRYVSPAYDSLYYQALQTIDEDARNLLYLKADQLAIDDAVIMPLYYDKHYRLLQSYVKNFPQNPMEYRCFKDVYFTPTI